MQCGKQLQMLYRNILPSSSGQNWTKWKMIRLKIDKWGNKPQTAGKQANKS